MHICFQMVMAVFAYIYHQSFVVPQDYTVEMIINEVMTISPCIWKFLNKKKNQPYYLSCSLDIEQPYFGGAENSVYKVRADISGENAWTILKLC